MNEIKRREKRKREENDGKREKERRGRTASRLFRFKERNFQKAKMAYNKILGNATVQLERRRLSCFQT